MIKSDGSLITFRSSTEDDIPFLYTVYRSTRMEELAPANFSEEQLEEFLKMQFSLQHTQYRKNYLHASFQIILLNGTPVGRLYINENEEDIRIIDIALLPKFRNQGIGGTIIKNIINTSENKNKTLSLHVEHNNPIFKFYQKCGFKVSSNEGVYLFVNYPSPKGNGLVTAQ